MSRPFAPYAAQFDADRPLNDSERFEEWMEQEGQQWIDDAVSELLAGNDYLFTTREGFTMHRRGVLVSDVVTEVSVGGKDPSCPDAFSEAAVEMLEDVAEDYFRHLEQDAQHEAEMARAGL